MRKILLTVFVVAMVVSCAKPREYPELVYDYIVKADEFSEADVTGVNLNSKYSEVEAHFIADAKGDIYIDVFSLRVPGAFYSMQDNTTGVQVATNSWETMVYYNGNLYIDGAVTDFFEQNKAVAIGSRVMLELRCMEDIFGAEFEFKRKKGDFDANISFYHEIYESQKVDGGAVSSLHTAPNVKSVDQLSSDHCTSVYSGVVAEDIAGRFRLDAINGMLTSLVREGFEMVERPSESMVLLCRGDSYVAIKSWSMKDVRANYINCIMKDE